MRAAWNLKFMQQVEPGSPPITDPSSMIFSKAIRHLKAYHRLQDNSARKRENVAFCAAVNAFPSSMLSDQGPAVQATLKGLWGKASVTARMGGSISPAVQVGGSVSPALQVGGSNPRILVGSSSPRMQVGGSTSPALHAGGSSSSPVMLPGGSNAVEAGVRAIMAPKPVTPTVGQMLVGADAGSPTLSPPSKGMRLEGAIGGVFSRLGSLFGLSGATTEQPPAAEPAAAKQKAAYLCGKCALLQHQIRLKREHVQCPTVGDFEQAKAAASKLMRLPQGRHFSLKAYLQWLKQHNHTEFARFTFSSEASKSF